MGSIMDFFKYLYEAPNAVYWGDADLSNGDVIRVERGVYDHYGIYVEDGGTVIHYTTPNDGQSDFKGIVGETSLEKFLDGDEYLTIMTFPETIENIQELSQPRSRYEQFKRSLEMDFNSFLLNFWNNKRIKEYHLYSGDETVERAKSKIGMGGYNVVLRNCETFAVWCKTNLKESSQVTQALSQIFNPF